MPTARSMTSPHGVWNVSATRSAPNSSFANRLWRTVGLALWRGPLGFAYEGLSGRIFS
jgi:hypothetical protein